MEHVQKQLGHFETTTKHEQKMQHRLLVKYKPIT